jgi:hypothetical protein
MYTNVGLLYLVTTFGRSDSNIVHSSTVNQFIWKSQFFWCWSVTDLYVVVNWGWTQVLRKGSQFLLHYYHPSCYFCYKLCDIFHNLFNPFQFELCCFIIETTTYRSVTDQHQKNCDLCLFFYLFFVWPLYCLSFDLRLLITPLLSSNFFYLTSRCSVHGR